MLDKFVRTHRDEIIRRYKAKDPSRSVPSPAQSEIDHGVTVFLHQLAATIGSGDPMLTTEIARTAALHGHDLLLRGSTESQVVHDYGDMCQAITDLAADINAPISIDDARTLNRCLDDAVAGALAEFGRGRGAFARARQ